MVTNVYVKFNYDQLHTDKALMLDYLKRTTIVAI